MILHKILKATFSHLSLQLSCSENKYNCVFIQSFNKNIKTDKDQKKNLFRYISKFDINPFLKVFKKAYLFWTLWDKARVGCFERTACILPIVKQITSPGGMHETRARAWRTGKTQRDPVEKEVGGGGSGWGIHVTPWLIHVNVWQSQLKCCEVISLQLIKINEKKFPWFIFTFKIKFRQHRTDL